MSEILGGARLWLDAIEGAQAVHTSSGTFLAWKQGLVLWTTVAEPKRAVTLPTLIVSVELDALSVACLGSGMLPVMLPVISGGVHGIPTRSILAARAQSEPAQGSFAVLTCVKIARGIWNGRSSYQKIAGILPTAAGLARRTGYQAPYELSSETRKSSIFHGLNIRWTRRLLGFWPLATDDGNNVDAQLTHSSTKNEFSSVLRGFGVTSDAALTGFLALFILIVGSGGWRSLHESSLMSVTLLLFSIHLLLEAYLLHIRKVNRIKTASKRACRGLKGDPRFSSTSGTWRSLHQCYTLGSRIVFKEVRKLLNAIIECPLEKGKQRIRWQCVSFSQTLTKITSIS